MILPEPMSLCYYILGRDNSEGRTDFRGTVMPVFISHSSKDEAVYSAICLALDGVGVERWEQESMTLGGSLASQLRLAIASCQVCIFIATRSSIESQWCLAELGSFWGSEKPVIIFLADPDLTDSVLPPQFKGNLMARNARDLVNAVKSAIVQGDVRHADDIKFFETSAAFGTEDDWLRLLKDTNHSFDIMGVALLAWRQTGGFRDLVIQKAKEGCVVRILTMHLDNPILPLLATDFEMLKSNLPANYNYFHEISRNSGNIEVRQLRQGIMHFFLTRSDEHAIVIQFLASQQWGRGPLWKCTRKSGFYGTAKQEFDQLWETCTSDSGRVEPPSAGQ